MVEGQPTQLSSMLPKILIEGGLHEATELKLHAFLSFRRTQGRC